MEFTEFDEGGDERILLVLGWGNRVAHENVRWLVDELLAAGYVVDVGELPTHIDDFEAAYLEPTQRRHDATDPDLLLSHSTGGLVTAHLDSPARRVYLSPWWGLDTDGSVLQRALFALPTSRPIIPLPDIEDELGALATDRQRSEGPDYAAPAFLRAMMAAQDDLPPFRDESVVFCSLTDAVVPVRAIGEHAAAERTVVYDGGHEFFSSRGRETVFEWVRAALVAGPDALTAPRIPTSTAGA